MTASKRDVERRLTDLEGEGDSGDGDGQAQAFEFEEASIATMLGAMTADKYDPMDGEPGLVRCSGEVYRVPDLPSGVFEGENGDGDGESDREREGRGRE